MILWVDTRTLDGRPLMLAFVVKPAFPTGYLIKKERKCPKE